MQVLGSLSVSAPSPTPIAGGSPGAAALPQRRASGDSIAKPVARSFPDPYHRCPDPSRDRYAQTAAIGFGLAALAPVLPAIAEGSSIEALAAMAATRLGPVASASTAFAKVAVREYAVNAAPFLQSFATRDAAAKAIGSQAWKATEETVRGALVGAGFAAGTAMVHGAIDHLTHGSERHRP